MVAAAICTIFAQPDRVAVAEQLDQLAGKLGRRGGAPARGRARHHDVRRLLGCPLAPDLIDEPD